MPVIMYEAVCTAMTVVTYSLYAHAAFLQGLVPDELP